MKSQESINRVMLMKTRGKLGRGHRSVIDRGYTDNPLHVASCLMVGLGHGSPVRNTGTGCDRVEWRVAWKDGSRSGGVFRLCRGGRDIDGKTLKDHVLGT